LFLSLEVTNEMMLVVHASPRCEHGRAVVAFVVGEAADVGQTGVHAGDEPGVGSPRGSFPSNRPTRALPSSRRKKIRAWSASIES
jgi:hypothetical protein